MGRLAWSQLRFRTVRLLALLLGMLLATTAFTVLTAATRTSQLRTIGTVSAHFVPAYDILIRPHGAQTSLEKQTGTVQPNFLSGLYGGITLNQWHQITDIPGVSVAAPIAMVGYTELTVGFRYDLPASAYAAPGRQLYRTATTWVSDGGTNQIDQPASYVYVTPRPLQAGNLGTTFSELLPGGTHASICQLQAVQGAQDGIASPFSPVSQASTTCWSKVNGRGSGSGDTKPANPGYEINWEVPVVIAAIDPVAEAKLDGLNHALVSGSYLAENSGRHSASGNQGGTFPVLAASGAPGSETAVTQLQELPTPSAPPAMDASWLNREDAAAGQTLATTQTTSQQAYQELLRELPSSPYATAVWNYWTVGPTTYRSGANGSLTPLLVHNPSSAFSLTFKVGTAVSVDNEDAQYRTVTPHEIPAGAPGTISVVEPRLVGTFDPAKTKEFDPLSAVPLGPYQPTVAAPASAASRAALHGGDLQPNQNLGGYVSQPVDLITTLAALPTLQNSDYGTGLDVKDPISAIRVRVTGVTGPNSVSLERIKEVAQQIEVRTHLTVDIVAGSSPSPTIIDLPAGKYGQPALTMSEDWVKKGVAVAILTAVDKDSVVLFTLILIVCVLFVANSATAAIRIRRRELGVLASLGWTRPRLFTAVLGEIAAIGLTAGLLGAVLALPLSSALGLHASPGRAALAVPVAVLVAVVAGLVPAWLAASADPVAAVRPPVLAVRRARHPRGITALAAANVLRTPGRALIGAASLAIGIGALTILTAMTFAFRGILVGSLLGNAIAVQARGVDYIAVTATVALGVLAVADVIFLNIRERAAELATIRAFGWTEAALSRLVISEAAIIGATGSLAGAALGLAAAADFAGQLPPRLLLIAAAATLAGIAVTATAALLPAQALRRLPVAYHLAEE
jgi:putative ABC transport system permease protein